MTAEYQHVHVERRGPALWVTLNRPEVRNAFNPAMIAELTALFTGVAGDGETRVVVLAGAGAAFCAGADLNWMREMAAYTYDENVADALRLVAMLEAVEGCAVPVVARVHGAALGGGVGLVAACDVAVAAADALFAFSEARLGIAPAVVAPFVLRKIGPGHARALFVTAERFDAARAERIGLVHHVAPAAHLDAAVQEVVSAVTACGPAALRACKRLVAEVPGMSREEACAYTAETIATLRASPEGQEGMRAFLEKRPPCFAKS
jgi:methylglutaconyl-CoA hydratase